MCNKSLLCCFLALVVMGECDQQKLDFVFEALGRPDPFEREVAIDFDLAEAERWKAERSDKAPLLSLGVTWARAACSFHSCSGNW